MNDIERSYNIRSPAVKRILLEAKELKESTHEYYARPLEENIFEWHFTVRGASDSDFSQGFYHGRIILPNEYPMKPPSIILLTPNGRFQLNRKICLSISGHHPETWMPSWSIRTVLLAIISFMPSAAEGHIGAVDYSPEERRLLAKKSHQWKCDRCGLIKNHLKTKPSVTSKSNSNNKNGKYEGQDNGNSIPEQENNVGNETTSTDFICNRITKSTLPSINNNHQLTEQQQSQQNSTWNHHYSTSTLIILYYSILFLIVALLVRRMFTHLL